jgi:adenylosuccinate lyase
MSTSPYIRITVPVVEPVSYMAKLWLNLAIAEKELGLPISEEAILQIGSNLVQYRVLFLSLSWPTYLALFNS